MARGRSVSGARRRGRLGVAASAALCCAAARAQEAEPGWGAEEIEIAPGGAFVGGLEILPGGNYAVFDGSAVVEVDPADGAVVRTLYTPASFVFGAFLALSPDGTTLYFGESSFGEVRAIDLATLAAPVVIQVPLPYDLAFDPAGQPFLEYSTGFFEGGRVALCDFAAGTLDDVFATPPPEVSGPIAFAANGDLYVTTPDVSGWPPPPDSTELLRLDAAEVAGAIGPDVLDESDADLVARLDAVNSLAVEAAGDLFVTDPFGGTLVEVNPGSGAERRVASAGDWNAFTYVRSSPGTRGTVEPWQPAEAGTLHVVRTDFFSFNGLTRVAPRRPELSTEPPPPVPPGRFDFKVANGVPNGLGVLFVAPAGVSLPEIELNNRTAPAPLFFGLDLAAGLIGVPIAFDAAGEFLANVNNSGYGVAIGLQLLAVDGAILRGTSAPFLLELL